MIVHGQDRGKVRVITCSRLANDRGVAPGMLLAEAQSLWPSSASNVVFEAHDPLADRRHLRELAIKCQALTPEVAIDDAESPDCLLIDATDCALTFGSEKELAEEAIETLARQGYHAVAAIADTIGAAWAIAHFARVSSRVFIIPNGQHAEAMRSLPVEALRLPSLVAQGLHDLSIHRVGQLLSLPRAELPSRFGEELLLWIDRAIGAISETLIPERPGEPLEAAWEFEPPIADGGILAEAIEQLLERLLKRIRLEHTGVKRLLCSLKLAGRDSLFFSVELIRPSASQRDLMQLVRLQIERLQISSEIALVQVQAATVAPLEFDQEEMFGSQGTKGWKEVTGLIERLSSRLGDKAVLRPQLVADPQPEFAWRRENWRAPQKRDIGVQRRTRSRQRREGSELSATSSNVRSAPGANATGLVIQSTRPLFLKLPRPVAVVSIYPGGSPQRFEWRDRHYLVERSWGPERIETGWWRGDDIRRDYFIVEATTGERFWLFRNLIDGSWFLHGAFE